MNVFTRRMWPVVLGALLLNACAFRVVEGSGNIVSESRLVSGFEAIILAGNGNVLITQGDTESLTIEADDNLLPHILSGVQGGTLRLGYDTDNWTVMYKPTKPVKYTVTVKDLTGLDLDGSGNISIEALETQQLAVGLAGSGQINIGQLTAEEFRFKLSGSGQVNVAGKVTSQTVDLSGSGQYEAGDLESDTTRIDIGGSGQGTVWAHETLTARISGSGTISYFGSPQVSMDNSGSGKMNSLGEK